MQDAAYKRSSDLEQANQAIDFGDAIYRVIADGVINQKADKTQKAWTDIRKEGDNLINALGKAAVKKHLEAAEKLFESDCP